MRWIGMIKVVTIRAGATEVRLSYLDAFGPRDCEYCAPASQLGDPHNRRDLARTHRTDILSASQSLPYYITKLQSLNPPADPVTDGCLSSGIDISLNSVPVCAST
jgi:hypothetical protein